MTRPRTEVRVGGARDVRATLDGDGGDACVVACPPHPQHRGSRSDERLRAVSRALGDRGVDCLRIDYGPWSEGRGEVRDARAAVAHCRADLGYGHGRVALFGYSFGASVALLATAGDGAADDGGSPGADLAPVAAVSALAPAARIGDDDRLDAVAAVRALSTPLQVVAGVRDATVDWDPVAAAARERGDDAAVVELPADHFFVGQAGTVADRVAPFLAGELDPATDPGDGD